MNEKLLILYVGSLNVQSNSYRRYKTLQALGHLVEGVDIDKYIYQSRFRSFHHHLNIGPGINKLNRKVIELVKKINPQILFVDNKPFLKISSLKKIRNNFPGIKIIDLITDDPTGRYKYAWSLCLKTAYLYNCHFVQRKVNIAELKNYGARRVELCYRSYDPAFNRQLFLTKEDQEKYFAEIGFVGTWEDSREDFIVHLLNNNLPVYITGNDWPKGKHWNIIKPWYRGPSVYGEEYIKTINGMKISLHFLRHANRDEQDSRTFEIPACGAFMLAERSEVHLSLFREDKEAVFFSTKDELLNKINYYRNNDEERNAIAINGMKRCRESDYTHEGRLKKVLEKIFE